MRKFSTHTLQNVPEFKLKLLQWAQQFDKVCYLNSNDSLTKNYSSFDFSLAVGAVAEITPSQGECFNALQKFHDEKKDWLFGFLSYDLKNEIEDLTSNNPDFLGFPLLHFFQPEFIFILEKNILKIGFLENNFSDKKVADLFNEISALQKNNFSKNEKQLEIKSRINREEYLKTVRIIQQHIRRGDVYELNFCQEFYAENAHINPTEIYEKLTKIAPNPFSVFYKLENKYLLSASPERFLKRIGNQLISQPIKGTIKRGANEQEDEELKKNLFNDQKERNENVMIVDLVRNDLSRIASRGSVKVEELFGIYTFSYWHQMISTISATVSEKVNFTKILKNTFPMGSMTGAPKIKAMQLIEELESTKRGLYSGALGYITPSGDVDFNVVIRSILYNEKNNYLSFMAGGAITEKSMPEQEYEECLLKATAMFEVLK
ncbi:MAG: anthranilate synthase component I family protein [Bacteroidia bacterium]